MAKLIKSIPVENELGEGVIWNAQTQRVIWTDIERQRLYTYDIETDRLCDYKTPERLSCFAPVLGQDYLVAAFASGFAYYDPDSGGVRWLHRVESDNPGTRLNDGGTDRQGRFWAGTMVEKQRLAIEKGRLYCLDHDASLSSKIAGLQITNSLCWSPCGTRMYHCDTPTQIINRYDYDVVTAMPSASSEFATTAAACYPDGSTTDSDGYLWNAQWGGSKIVRYSPDGAEDLVITTPMVQPTCVAFGGANMNLLFVTSAWQGLNKTQRELDPHAGDLLIYETSYRGVEDAPFSPVHPPSTI